MSNRLRTPASRRRELLVRVILALAVCVAVVMAFNGSTSSLRQIARSFGIAVVYSGCTAALGYLTLPRIGPGCGRLPAPWDWTVFLAACVAIAIAGCLLSVALLAALGIFPLSVYWRAFAASVWLCIAITLAFGIGNFLYESMRGKLERVMLEEERARFSSLESRIHPHFLFNTLNSISALIREDPGKAEQTVQQLSALLRYSLDTHTSGLTRLGKELRIVTDYLEIERTRFGDRLKFTIDAPGALEDLELPPMAIQTLVENSIKHAVSRSRSGGEIRIVARTVEDRFLVEVSDDGPGFAASDMQEGHGLDNLRARLESVFAGDASLRISSEGGGSTVTLSMPRKRVLAQKRVLI
jgi:two-component system sensor histidine kinase AlgZ